MKNIILGLVAAFALVSFAAPVIAEEAPAGDAAKTDGAKKEKKSKKGDKKGEAPAAGGDAAKK